MPDGKKNKPEQISGSNHHRPLRVTLIYMGVATLWLLASNYLLPQTISNPQLQGLFEIAKDLLFAMVTGTFLYYLLRKWMPQEPQTDKLLQHFFDMPFVGMAIWSAKNGEWIRFNDCFCDLLGYSRERLKQISWDKLSTPDDLAVEKTLMQKIVDGEIESYTIEKRLLRIDDSIINVNVDVQCVRDEHNSPSLFIAIIQDVTAYRHTIEALRESEERFHTIFDGALDGIVMVDKTSGAYITGNTAFCNMLGYTAEEIAGMSFRDIHPKEALLSVENDFSEIADGKRHYSNNIPALRKDGSIFYTDIKGSTITVLDREYVIEVFRDTSERNVYENRLQRLSQFYAALSQCNETIIRSKDEHEMLQDICRIAVDIADISAAWISIIDKDDDSLKRITGYGPGNEEIAKSACTHKDNATTQNNPVYQAFHESHAIWIQEFSADIVSQQCHNIATKYGWRSTAALPLYRQGSIFGVLNLYANIENAFGDDVQRLLNEMAHDIGFALDNFTLEEKRRASERSLAESEQRFRGLVEQSLSGIYIIQNGQYVYANPRLAEILGVDSYRELVGHSPIEFILPEDRQNVEQQIDNLTQGTSQHLTYEAGVRRPDGKIIDIGVHGAMATHMGVPAVIGLVQDVTDKKHAEAQLNTYVEKLQASLMQTVEVATVLSEMRDPYTAGHEHRVAEIAVAIGKEMGLDEYELEGLRVAGYLHDIGKINIPSEILSKPGKLTELEYEIIKGHPQSGYNALKDVDFPWPVAQVALQHHERINGSGYPQGLKGDEIILQARITAVADVVEAMGSHRPYRPGLGLEPALKEIERGSGTLYDPIVTDACLRLFREKGYSLPA